MKTISLSSDGTSLNPEIHIDLVSRSFFPNSDIDYEQWSVLWRNELSRYRQAPENFEPSFIARVAANGMIKRQGRMAVAGLVLHCYLFLIDNNVKPSLEKASKLASEVVYTVGKARLNVAGKVKNINLDGDQVGVKKAWREYRSIAPIAAARLVFSQNDRATSIYSLAPSEILEFTSLALHFQERSISIPEHKNWSIVKLIDAPTSILGKAELFSFPTLIDLKEDIEQAYSRCSF